MRYHVHPLTIVANLGRVLYLTIIPVLRGFFYALQGDLGQWMQSAWIDILIFLFMIVLAVWRWWVVTYTFDDQEFLLDTGWLMRRRIRVPWDRIITVSVLESFYLRPFRAARLRADTIGGSAGQADFSILVWNKAARRILRRHRTRNGQQEPREYAPKTSSILALALLTSNSLGGILFISTFLSQAGRLLGNEFSDLVIGTFEEATRVLAFGIPPAAAAIAYMLLAGWLIGFLLTFFRYKNSVVSRNKGALNISGGIFTIRNYCINYSDVNFIDIRQSIVSKLLRLYSLYISAVGYAKLKDDISCVIPAESHQVFALSRERLFPTFSPSRRQLKPPLTRIMRFIGAPLALCIIILAATALLIWRFPSWRSFILFVGLMSMVPSSFFLVVRLVDFVTGGVAKSGKYYTLRYSKGFYIHTVVFPEDKIVSIELRQSPFQKRTPNCDLFIGTRAETHFTHCCRNLNKEQLQVIFKL